MGTPASPVALRDGVGALAVVELAPLAERTEHEDRDDAHSRGGTHCPDECPNSSLHRTFAVALQPYEGVPDQPTGEATGEDRHEGHGSGCGGGQRRHRPCRIVGARHHLHRCIVRGQPTGDSAGTPRVGDVRVTVVVPTYNEAGNVDALLRGVRRALPDAQVLVVDDNSADGTADLVETIGRELGGVEVLRREHKAGLGAAYRAGFRAAIDAGAEVCVQMDADLSHDPAVLPALVGNVEHGADVAIGSRYVPGGITENWPWRRQALSRWGNRYAAGMLGLAVNDATSGYRAYSTAALERMQFEAVHAEGYGFQVEMTHRIVRVGGRVVEFPITFRDRVAGESKMSGNIVSEALVLVLELWLRDVRARRSRRRLGG